MLANGVPGRILYLLLTNLQELAQLISSQLFDNVEQFFHWKERTTWLEMFKVQNPVATSALKRLLIENGDEVYIFILFFPRPHRSGRKGNVWQRMNESSAENLQRGLGSDKGTGLSGCGMKQ